MTTSSKIWMAIACCALILCGFLSYQLLKPSKCQVCGKALENNICPDICKTCKKAHLQQGKCPTCSGVEVCATCKKIKTDGKCNCQTGKTNHKPDLNRFYNRNLKALFSMSGRGSDANWGFKTEANFKYDVIVLSESQIKEKKALSDGGIKVVEKRKFSVVHDNIALSDMDFSICLDTLPLGEFQAFADFALSIISGFFPTAGTIVKLSTDTAFKYIRSFDNLSVRKLLKTKNVKVSAQVEKFIDKMFGNCLLKGFVDGKLRKIQGKTYILTYMQNREGDSYFTYTNEDGSAVTEEEEIIVLARINMLLDQYTVPNVNCAQGDTWNISADKIQECFDPFVDGHYSGNISVERMADDEHGNWYVKMNPTKIEIIGNQGSVTGTINLKKGNAIVDSNKFTAKDIFVEGNARLKKVSRHHLFFTAIVKGWSVCQGRLVTIIPEN